MDEQQERTRDSSGCLGAAAVLTLVMLPIGYVLSCGPAVWLHERGIIDENMLTIYMPLVWLGMNSETAERVIAWYVKFWQ